MQNLWLHTYLRYKEHVWGLTQYQITKKIKSNSFWLKIDEILEMVPKIKHLLFLKEAINKKTKKIMDIVQNPVPPPP